MTPVLHRSLCRRLTKTALAFKRLYSNPASTHTEGHKLKVLFLGRDEFSCLVLKELYNARDVWDELVVATNPDQRVGRRGNLQTISPLKEMVERCPDIRLELIPASKAEFRKWTIPPPFSVPGGFDASDGASPTPSPTHVLVTASFGRIITSKQLSQFLPSRRLNVHPSLLPQYRGPAPIQHALLNGEKETGVCVVEMLPAASKKKLDQTPPSKSGIDAGDVWISKSLTQPGTADFKTMRNTLGGEGGKLLVQLLRNFRDRAEPLPQPQVVDSGIPLRPAPMVRSEDAIFDPITCSAEQTYRRWKAIGHQRPISCLVQISSLDGKIVSKRAVQLDDLQVYFHAAGAIHALPSFPGAMICSAFDNSSDKALFIRCSDGGVVAVGKVKPDGKAACAAQAFWNGLQSKNKLVKLTGHEIL